MKNISFLIALVVMVSCSENKKEEYYIILNVNTNSPSCYLKKPLEQKQFVYQIQNYEYQQFQQYNCSIPMPKEIFKNHNKCNLDGIHVEESGQVHIKSWSCNINKTLSYISIRIDPRLGTASVLCSLTCD